MVVERRKMSREINITRNVVGCVVDNDGCEDLLFHKSCAALAALSFVSVGMGNGIGGLLSFGVLTGRWDEKAGMVVGEWSVLIVPLEGMHGLYTGSELEKEKEQ